MTKSHHYISGRSCVCQVWPDWWQQAGLQGVLWYDQQTTGIMKILCASQLCFLLQDYPHSPDKDALYAQAHNTVVLFRVMLFSDKWTTLIDLHG